MRAIALNLGLVLSAASVAGRADVIEEVTVTATLREQSLIEAPVSITVLDEQRLRDAGRQHFEDVLAAAPNLHWAAGTSRPRYFQIRGIGEREQYEGAPNPSVGFLIDDIDFSGAAMPATLFDVERIEVLRGPQGMRYGANALAGLIVMRGHDPAGDAGFATEASLGDYDSRSIGVMATAPVESLDSAWRVAVQQHVSDGFRENAFLGRDDTNDRDELTARAKWRWRAGDATTLDLTWLHADIDNGYDAWSIDNTRRSLADDPGKDAQRANGASLRLTTSLGSVGRLTVIAAGSNIESEYSFDGDWGNAQSWAPYTYDYFYRAITSRRTRSLEARLASEAVARRIRSPGSSASTRSIWTRASTRRASANTSILTFRSSRARRMIGCTATTTHATSRSSASSTARSAHAGGGRLVCARSSVTRTIRIAASRTPSRAQPMRMNGIECGADRPRFISILASKPAFRHAVARLQGGRLQSRPRRGAAGALRPGISVEPRRRRQGAVARRRALRGRRRVLYEAQRYADRDGRATRPHRRSEQLPVHHGQCLGRKQSRRGGERALARRDHIELGVALGLLETSYSGYRSAGVGLDDREQAHAPEYQASFNATWRHPLGWMARVDVNAVDDYYFDVPPNDATRGRLCTHEREDRLRSRTLERVSVGPQRFRRGLHHARLLLRQRAAAVREQTLHPARRAATDWRDSEVGVLKRPTGSLVNWTIGRASEGQPIREPQQAIRSGQLPVDQ